MGNFCVAPSKSQSPTIITKSSIGNDSETNTNITSKLSSISNTERTEGQILEVPNLRIYPLCELKTATGNFKPDRAIGGGFSMVFKGWVDRSTLNPIETEQGIVVAVKILNPEVTKRLEESQEEVDFLGRISHPNVVKLLGYCIEDRDVLVYEYMAKGSLENHLFGATGTEPLSWNVRLQILIGAARGLAFLHYSKSQVIYEDFKPSKILLDSNYNAKLSDFGISKNEPWNVQKNNGYAAPEYIATGHLYMKSDVYGFGVVMLEMLSGLRAFDLNRPKQKQNLVNWAKPYLLDRRNLVDLVMDKSLEGQYKPKAALQAAQLSLHCLDTYPQNRPSMEEVADILQKVDDIGLSRSNGSDDRISKTVK